MMTAMLAGRLAALGCVVTACTSNSPPEIHDLADQVATVGTELVVNIDGSDPDGNRLTYGVHADVSLQGNAMLTQTPSGVGVFRWTPLAEDLGTHAFDFTVDDGATTTTATISIEVSSASGSVPVFRQPLGEGTVVDLMAHPCIDLTVVIEDSDSPVVTIAQEAPVIAGAMLTTVDGQDATWHWCPTVQQKLQDRYTLILSADDGDNPKTIKPYVIVLSSMGPKLVINEVDYDQVGTDTAEFIELFNPSGGAASLAGIQVVLVNGATNTVYSTIDLTSQSSLAGGHYLVIAGPNVTVPAGAMKLDPVWTQDQIQNGAPDGLAVIDNVTHTVIDALSYEGSITAATISGFTAPVSLVEGTPLDPAVADSNTAVLSLCRFPNGTDANDAATDWTTCSTPTPGASNVQ
jgi:hypothetical protein